MKNLLLLLALLAPAAFAADEVKDETVKTEEELQKEKARKEAKRREMDAFFSGLVKKHGGEGEPSDQAKNAVTRGWTEEAGK